MDKENLIISAFLNDKNGDDGAIVGKWCLSKDLFFEEVHFKRSWLSLEQIAAKAMLVNISDAVVMNAVPKYALLGLALPQNISEKEIKNLQKGFLKTAKKWGIEIIGGDTISSDKIAISISLLSKIRKKAVFRTGLREGDFLAFTGKLGQVLRDFQILQNGGQIASNSRFITPKLRAKFFYKIASKVRCAMDISDGLSKDLSRLLKLNKMGIEWLCDLSEDELFSGEEYEILFSFAPKYKDEICKIATNLKVPLTIFARASKQGEKYEFKGKEHHFV